MSKTHSLLTIAIIGALLISASLSSARRTEKLALIYKGPGSCEQYKEIPGCSEAAAEIAKRAGFEVQFVGPEGAPEAVWRNASVYIQTGGRARIQVQTMTPEFKQQIVNFTRNGGGYVGFCAGAFLAGEKFGWINKKDPTKSFESDALGLVKGYVHYFDEYDEQLSEELLALIMPTIWNGKKRFVYWELGPYLDAPQTQDTHVIAYYHDKDGKPRADRVLAQASRFGDGRVVVSATHPEAPPHWREWYKIKDNDGIDYDLAIEMVQWAAGSN